MSEMANLVLVSSVIGLVIGAVLGMIGRRSVFLVALGLGGTAVVVQLVQAARDYGWGQIGHVMFAGLTGWGMLIAGLAYLLVRSLQARPADADLPEKGGPS